VIPYLSAVTRVVGDKKEVRSTNEVLMRGDVDRGFKIRAVATSVVLFLMAGILGCSGSAPPQKADRAAEIPPGQEATDIEETFPVVTLDDEQHPNGFMGVVVTNLTMGEAYRVGRKVLLALQMRNTGIEPTDIHFPQGQIFDFAVFNESGVETWRYSRHRMFSGSERLQTVGPGAGEAFRVVWEQVDNHGNRVPQGLYVVRGYLMAKPILMTEEVDIVITE
jgi:hypothetical protein